MKKSKELSKLRLEWVEAGTLTENPRNWRRHSQEQLQSIRELMSDPEIGWAGACLFNERTGRLIDGHARREVVDPKAMVPVLMGDWSEEAEAKILATLDPVGTMAAGDAEAYAALIETVQADGLWVRDLIHNTLADLKHEGAEDKDAPADAPGDGTLLPQMECQPFEHYDYVMLMFRNDLDLQRAHELLGIVKVEVEYPGGLRKVGLGRCIDGAQAIDRLTGVTPAPVVRYEHHGKQVSVRADLRGRHREFCLCYQCGKFKPNEPGNCPIAQAVYKACVKLGITTPMWECPQFVAPEKASAGQGDAGNADV